MAPKKRKECNAGGASSTEPIAEKRGRIELGADAFDCSICENPMIKQIFQCSAGHSVCEDCLNKLNSSAKPCPSCKAVYPQTPIRNFSLEMLAAQCCFTCRHCCAFSGKPAEHGAHEALCELRPMTCPLAGCNHSCTTGNILEHLCNTFHTFLKVGHYAMQLDSNLDLMANRKSKCSLLSPEHGSPKLLASSFAMDNHCSLWTLVRIFKGLAKFKLKLYLGDHAVEFSGPTTTSGVRVEIPRVVWEKFVIRRAGEPPLLVVHLSSVPC